MKISELPSPPMFDAESPVTSTAASESGNDFAWLDSDPLDDRIGRVASF